jgi:hypothetical protein
MPGRRGTCLAVRPHRLLVKRSFGGSSALQAGQGIPAGEAQFDLGTALNAMTTIPTLATATAAPGRNSFLQLDELEAPLTLGLPRWRGLILAARLHWRLDLEWFHFGTSFLVNGGLRYRGAVIYRRADRAPGRCWAGDFCWR